MKRLRRLSVPICLLISAFLIALSHPANAASQHDIELIAKALSYTINGPKGDVRMAILYNPNSEKSVNEANRIAEITKEPYGFGKVRLKGKKIPISQLRFTESSVWYVASDVEGYYDVIREQAMRKKALTVSHDRGCLGEACVMTVKSRPSIDIYLDTELQNVLRLEFRKMFELILTKQ